MGGADDALQPDQVFRVGEFDIVIGPRDDFDGFARGFQQRCVVRGPGQAGPMRCQQHREPERLRRLRSEQPGSRARCPEQRRVSTRLSVSATCGARDGTGGLTQGGDQGRDRARRV